MAERIVSPGVFTREKDLSFLPQAIGEIGAAIVGPTQKGPAFVPTIVRSFNEFVEVFGDGDIMLLLVMVMVLDYVLVLEPNLVVDILFLLLIFY